MVAWAMVLVGGAAATVDLPTFYRAPFFQAEGRSDPGDWTSKIMVRYGQGHTWDSLDEQSKKRTLFSGVGSLDIARLGLEVVNAATQPTTDTYWTIDHNKFKNADLPTGNDGKVDLSGRCEAQDLGIELTQYIKYGLFAHLYVPIRQVKIDHIGYKNKGAAEVAGVTIANFFANDFDKILKEHGMQPLTTPFKKSGVSDVTASLGWHGYGTVGSEWIMDLAGSLQAGVIVPVAKQLDDAYVAAVPLGYNHSYGFLARGAGEVGIFDWVAVGAYADAIVFLSQNQTLRMRTHEQQSGWLRLGKGFAKVETGTVWDCGGYARLGALVRGLSIFGGYSFTRQEAARLTVKDAAFKVMITLNVVTAGAASATNIPHESNAQSEMDAVVNADKRLSAWEVHALHLGATLEFGGKKATFNPHLQVEYTHPFDGKHIFKAPVVGGTIGLQFSLGF
jgi:hypothetical protein